MSQYNCKAGKVANGGLWAPKSQWEGICEFFGEKTIIQKVTKQDPDANSKTKQKTLTLPPPFASKKEGGDPVEWHMSSIYLF